MTIETIELAVENIVELINSVRAYRQNTDTEEVHSMQTTNIETIELTVENIVELINSVRTVEPVATIDFWDVTPGVMPFSQFCDDDFADQTGDDIADAPAREYANTPVFEPDFSESLDISDTYEAWTHDRDCVPCRNENHYPYFHRAVGCVEMQEASPSAEAIDSVAKAIAVDHGHDVAAARLFVMALFNERRVERRAAEARNETLNIVNAVAETMREEDRSEIVDIVNAVAETMREEDRSEIVDIANAVAETMREEDRSEIVDIINAAADTMWKEDHTEIADIIQAAEEARREEDRAEIADIIQAVEESMREEDGGQPGPAVVLLPRREIRPLPLAS